MKATEKLSRIHVLIEANDPVKAQEYLDTLTLDDIATIEKQINIVSRSVPIYNRVIPLLADRKDALLRELAALEVSTPELETVRNLQIMVEEHNKERQRDRDNKEIDEYNLNVEASAHKTGQGDIKRAVLRRHIAQEQPPYKAAVKALQQSGAIPIMLYSSAEYAMQKLTEETNKLVASSKPEIEQLVKGSVLKLVELGGWPENEVYLGNLSNDKSIDKGIAQKIKDGLLLSAFTRGDDVRVGTLLSEGANPNRIVNTKGESLLHIAVASDNHKMVDVLLEAGAVNIKDKANKAPLQYAKTADMVTKLMNGGISEGAEELMFQEAQKGGLTIVKALLDGGARPNLKTSQTNTTALMLAAKRGDAQMVQTLLMKGADPHIENNKGETAFDMAKDKATIGKFEAYAAAEKHFKEKFVNIVKNEMDTQGWFLKGSNVKKVENFSTENLVEIITNALNVAYKEREPGTSFVERIRPTAAQVERFEGEFKLSFVEDWTIAFKAGFKSIISEDTYQQIKFTEMSKVIYDKLSKTPEFKELAAPEVAKKSHVEQLEQDKQKRTAAIQPGFE